MNIVVYAIAKNESKFVNRWMDSMSEANQVVVLDTGSTDDTVEKLRARGATVDVMKYVEWKTVGEYRKIMADRKPDDPLPWRFDTARNASLDLAEGIAPNADVLVCTDLDEYFLPGWRKLLEDAWRTGGPYDSAQYAFVWRFTPDGRDDGTFKRRWIHAPHMARWSCPVHETLETLAVDGSFHAVDVPGMRLEHHPDSSKSREQYLALLELAVSERPNDPRMRHYLGREYRFRGMWDDCRRTLETQLGMKGAWDVERAQAMRFLAQCSLARGDYWGDAKYWLWRAVREAPRQREAANDLIDEAYKREDWALLLEAARACLAVTERTGLYVTEEKAWSARPWGLYALALWHCRRYVDAVIVNSVAMEKADPERDGWIFGNMELFREKAREVL